MRQALSAARRAAAWCQSVSGIETATAQRWLDRIKNLVANVPVITIPNDRSEPPVTISLRE
jgi:hypothetical protein